MSGDVQPRKRRDKKRKKDENNQGDDPVIQQQTSPAANDDFNIHVHKESSTGGGICAKIVFFILFAILGVLIGLIIIEHRGLTDLDTADSDTRFAKVFDGWTEPPGHDDHDDPHAMIHDEHDEHDDEGGHSEEGLQEMQEDEEEEEEATEEDEVEASEEETEETQEGSEEEEEEEEEATEEEEDEVNASEDEEENATDEDNDEEEETAEISKEDEDEEDDDETGDVENVSENASPEEQEEDDDDDEDDENASVPENETKEQADNEDESVEQLASEEKQTDDGSKEDVEETKDQEASDEDENAAESEAVLPQDDESGADDNAEEVPQEGSDQESANVAVKFGVGVALLVVAHVVLVRKWNPDKNQTGSDSSHPEGITADLSRRKTIVVPPTLEQVEQHIENLDAEYSEEDYDDEDQYSEEGEEGEDENYDKEIEKTLDSKFEPVTAKQQYTELRSTYTRSLTPESDPEEEEEEDDEEEEVVNLITADVKTYNFEIRNEEEADDGDGEEEEIEDEEEVEEEEEEEEEVSDNDDEDLLKKLEAKYGKIADEESDEEKQFESWKKVKVVPSNNDEQTDSEGETVAKVDKKSGGNSMNYANENITNSEDWAIKDELDYAQDQLHNNVAKALSLFNNVLERFPSSPRALYGLAQTLDKSAETKKSNDLLLEAINKYAKVVTLNNVPDYLFKLSAERCINRMRFRGQYGRAIGIHNILIKRFPNDPDYRNQLAVTYLTVNKLPEAKNVLHEILLKWRNNGFAQVHYGFVLKIYDNDIENSISFMKKGIASKEPGVIDGRFYFHLGDALTRMGRKTEAMQVYQDGVSNKVFPSVYQRSLYNVPRLKAKPWWDINETPFSSFLRKLEDNWISIRNEGLSLINKEGFFKDESENLRDVGEWKQFELFARGVKLIDNCKKCPITCKIIDTLQDARECRRGQSKFSVMHPGTHVWPHCGPTNCRLRSHLGLKIPNGTYIRVANKIKTWHEGQVLLFDDSFEHEVWHNGSETRLVLIVDIWHPELTKSEKNSLPAI